MSPRTARQYHDIREEKKTLIMEVGLQHFAANGFHATTISHLAKHAGISKGLMYHYFTGKDELLTAIIQQSVNEVNSYLDMDRDGRLNEEEFVFFIRRLSVILKEKRSFWILFFQLLLQNEVRDRMRSILSMDPRQIQSMTAQGDSLFLTGILKLILDYFIRKTEVKEAFFDPYFEFNLFIIEIKGFAINYIYRDHEDEYYEKTVEAIIERFK